MVLRVGGGKGVPREAAFEAGLAATGLGLTAFLAAHEAMLASLWAGPAAMDRTAAFLEGTGLVGPGVLAVWALFLSHALVAVRRIPFRLREAGAFAARARSLLHWDTASWGLQILSAVPLAVLAVLHLRAAGGDLPIEAAKSAARVRVLADSGFYDILLLMAALHACIGLERVATKWGFPGRAVARTAAWLLFAAILGAGFTTMVALHGLGRGLP